MSILNNLILENYDYEEAYPDPNGSILKWHLTKWVPQFRIEEGDIKLDMNFFYIFISVLVFMFLCMLGTVLHTQICYKKGPCRFYEKLSGEQKWGGD